MLGLSLVLAAVTGFIALSYELVWYRVVSFATWGRPAAFGLLLAAYLLGIAFGSRESRRFCKDDQQRGDPRSLRALGGFLFAANVTSFLVAPAFGRAMATASWMIAFAFGLVVIAAGMMGAVLPLLSHFAIAPDDRAGQKLSYVYFANIVGSTLGSLVTGFVFLDVLSLSRTCLVLGVLGTVVAGALFVYGSIGPARVRALVTSVVVLVGVVAIAPYAYGMLYERLLFRTDFDSSRPLAEVIENKSGVITVTQDGTVYGGGAYDGRLNTSIMTDRNGIIRAYALGAIHPAPREVLMIGLASGSWAQVIANEPDVVHLRIIEINPGYLELIEHHPDVASVLHNPKVTIEIDDGRRWLHRHPEARFDAIVMNTTWHWRAHSTNLLSREFLELARAHFLPGGIIYYNTTQSADVQKTAMTVFPYGMRIINFVAAGDAPIAFDAARFKRLMTEYRIDGKPVVDMGTEEGRKLIDSLDGFAGTIDQAPDPGGIERRESVLARTAGATIVTDDNMAVEFKDPSAMFEAPVK